MNAQDSYHAVVSIDQIQLNPHQPRKVFHEKELEDLCQSIQSVGLIHPPTVLKKGEHYELVSGERRFRACQRLGMEKLAVFIRSYTQDLSAQAALVENIQRVDLNPLEVSLAMKQMMLKQGLTQDELAKVVGKKRSTVANYLRLLGLPLSIQKALRKNLISMGHAKVLLSIEGLDKQLALLKAIIDKQLSVRQAEASLRQEKRQIEGNTLKRYGAENRQLEQHLQDSLGRRVSLQAKSDGSGQLIVEYYSLEDFDTLLQQLGCSALI